MTTYTVDLPEVMRECLSAKARENFREMNQEILHRINKTLQMERYISENEVGLFKVLSQLRDVQSEEEGMITNDRFTVSSEFPEHLN